MSVTSSFVPSACRAAAPGRIMFLYDVAWYSLLPLASVSHRLHDNCPLVSRLCHLTEGAARAATTETFQAVLEDMHMQTCRDVGSVGSVGYIWRKKMSSGQVLSLNCFNPMRFFICPVWYYLLYACSLTRLCCLSAPQPSESRLLSCLSWV